VISVVIPVHNEGRAIQKTLASIARTRSQKIPVEVVVVDDASTDRCCDTFGPVANEIPIKLIREKERLGVGRSRNRGVRDAKGELVFITDAHVIFPDNWDTLVVQSARTNCILAATITDDASAFSGFGCSLVVPYMGTRWNRKSLGRLRPVQVASCAGTILERALFDRIGGYDPGMIVYGAAEPEFSVRAWLAGAEILSLPDLEVRHHFKTPENCNRFLSEMRPFIIHNNLRFGLLYLSELASFQMIRHFAMEFPEQIQTALQLLQASDVWERRSFLYKSLQKNFGWFIKRFDLKDQVGREIL